MTEPSHDTDDPQHQGPSPAATTESGQAYRIGAPVVGPDGGCGHLERVVLDPVARTLTHLVVAPNHGHDFGRLVPVDLVEHSGETIRLRCGRTAFDKLGRAEETHFLPVRSEDWGYRSDQVLSWPYYSFSMGAPGLGAGAGLGGVPRAVIYDRVPAGGVEVHRGDAVSTIDGAIGSVQGLLVDTDERITHVLLREGHLWGRRQVAIPIQSVTRLAGGIHVDLTNEQVGDLVPFAGVAAG